jgi:Protein of unknown function with PCYCGC motif
MSGKVSWKEDAMRKLGKLASAMALVGLGAALVAIPQFAASQLPQESNSEPVPAYHAQPPTGELPSTVQPAIYTGDKLVFNAYAVAARVKKILYQEPCYCHCDRSSGHGSLLDCFAGQHGARCDICQKEVFYSYEQSRHGKNATQIREGIIRGDWEKVDLAKYEKDYLPPR